MIPKPWLLAYYSSPSMPEITKFDDPVVLVGGGEVDSAVLQRFSHLPLVAADGGANYLRKLGIMPSVVLGDLDSVDDRSFWKNQSKVIEIAEQDTTDFEKCLYSIEAPYFIAVGFTGGQLDHTLASLHVMHKLHRQKKVIVVDSNDAVIVSSDQIDLQLQLDIRVSLFPLGPIQFKSSDGLKYPLDNLTMQSGSFIGTSNCSVQSEVSITPQLNSGCYALILPATELDALIRYMESGAGNVAL